jgi:hypothetical protein
MSVVLREPAQQPSAPGVAVGHQAGDRAHEPEGEKHVQQRSSRHDQVQAVEGEQQARDATKQGGSSQPADHAGEHQHGERRR